MTIIHPYLEPDRSSLSLYIATRDRLLAAPFLLIDKRFGLTEVGVRQSESQGTLPVKVNLLCPSERQSD